jgi:hypothetical protein
VFVRVLVNRLNIIQIESLGSVQEEFPADDEIELDTVFRMPSLIPLCFFQDLGSPDPGWRWQRVERFAEGVPYKTADNQVATSRCIVWVTHIDAVVSAVREVVQQKAQGAASGWDPGERGLGSHLAVSSPGFARGHVIQLLELSIGLAFSCLLEHVGLLAHFVLNADIKLTLTIVWCNDSNKS